MTAPPLSTSDLVVAPDHAAYAGHFPAFPILPGAVLLDEALHQIALSRGLDLTRWQLAAIKFLEIVRPGDTLTLEHSAPSDAAIRFTVRSARAAVASGILSASAVQPGDTRGA